jgi:hypothetical protein
MAVVAAMKAGEFLAARRTPGRGLRAKAPAGLIVILPALGSGCEPHVAFRPPTPMLDVTAVPEPEPAIPSEE